MSWENDVFDSATLLPSWVVSLPSSVPVPVLDARRFAPPDIFTVRPAASWSGDTTEMDRWLRAVLAEAVQQATWEWFAARGDWPERDLLAAWTQEWSSVHARATCRASAAVQAEVGRLLSDQPGRPPRVPAGPVWLGMPRSRWTCGCVHPPHARGIARCEWNDEHGWRPRPAAQPGDGGTE